MVKRAVILHGKDGHGRAHWLPWLTRQLEAVGYIVWTPDLPHAGMPDARRWTDFLLANKEWDFNNNIVIGHSAGAVETLQLAAALPKDVYLKAAIACAAFSHELPKQPEWQELRGLFEPPLQYETIRQKAGRLIFVHAQDDPWCPPDQAAYLAEKTGGELITLQSGRHFTTSLDPHFKQFPQLYDILKERKLL